MNDSALRILAWTFGLVAANGALALLLARLIRCRLNGGAYREPRQGRLQLGRRGVG